MQKSRKSLRTTKNLLFIVPILLVSGCSNSTSVSLDDYVSELEYHEGFTILDLGDIHESVIANLDADFEYLTNVIYSRAIVANDMAHKEEYAPDLIVLNGDTFMDANKLVVKKFFEFMDSLDIPFAYTYGNHDYEGQYSHGYIDKIVQGCKNSVLCNPEDDVYGNSNYVVNLTNDGDIVWQVYMMDSNSYYKSSYDVLHDDQVEWYRRQVEYANGITSAEQAKDMDMVPSIMFMHIPLREYKYAWTEIAGDTRYGYDEATGSVWYMIDSGVASGYKDSDLFPTIQEYKSTQAVISNHDHTHNCDFVYSGDGDYPVHLIYANKSSINIYYDPDTMGGMFFTLNEDKTFTTERIRVDYEGTASVITDEMLSSGNIIW